MFSIFQSAPVVFLMVALVVALVLSCRNFRSAGNNWKSAKENWQSAAKSWKSAAALYAYSDRMWWETGKLNEATAQIRRREKVEYACCDLCGKELPAAALLLEGETGLVCGRCSQEARAARRGSYKDAEAVQAS